MEGLQKWGHISGGATRTLPYEEGGTWNIEDQHSRLAGGVFAHVCQRLQKYIHTCRVRVLIIHSAPLHWSFSSCSEYVSSGQNSNPPDPFITQSPYCFIPVSAMGEMSTSSWRRYTGWNDVKLSSAAIF